MAESFAFQLRAAIGAVAGIGCEQRADQSYGQAGSDCDRGKTFGQIQHDGHWQYVEVARQINERFACLRLNVGGIDNRQLRGSQPFARDEVQDFKGIIGSRLVVFVVRHKPTAEIRRENFRGFEVLARERSTCRIRRADQGHQRKFGNRYFHRENTPIWVGAPTVGSSGPTGRNVAVVTKPFSRSKKPRS